MMNVFAKKIIGDNTLSYLLAGVIALSSVQMAQAADRCWKGGGSDTLWSTQANWNDSVVPTSSDNAHFRADTVTGGFSGKTVTLRDSYSVKVLHVSNGSNAEDPIVFEADQNSAHGLTFTDDGWLGYYAEGALWLKSGTYTFAKSLRVGVNADSKGYSADKSSFWLKVGDGVSPAVLNAKGTYGPILGRSSKLIADKATLDFTGKAFNMYSQSYVNIKDSAMTANFINLAVNENNNCTAVFNGGSLTLSALSAIGYGKNAKGYMYATNLTFTTGQSNLYLGGHGDSHTGAKGVVDKKGGDWTIGGTLYIGTRASSNGEFTSDGGSVTVGNNTRLANVSGATGTLTIKNGTFATKSIQTAGTGILNLDGAILKAGANNVNLIDSGITVNIGDNGATIDTDSYSVTIASNLGTAGNTGAMAFTGGGTLTLSGAANWTGGTTVNAGTVFAFPAAQKSAIVNNGITVAISETDAGDGVTVLKITDGNGTFSADDIATMTLTGNENNRYALVLAENGAKVAISDTLTGEYVWNGGNSAESWCTDGNWVKNNVAGNWYDSTAAVFNNSGDAVTVDSAVVAASVTFRANATISGAATLTAPSVVVSDGVAATISAPTAGALVKSGAGLLTLESSREALTTVSEGTLKMDGSASIDWSNIVLGTDEEKAVTLEVGENATIANMMHIGNVEDMTASVRKEGGNWQVSNLYIGCAKSATAAFYNEGGTLVIAGNLDIGQNAEATSALFEISGGMVTNSAYYIHLGAVCPGVMTVKTGAKYGMSSSGYGIIVGGNAAGTLNVEGGDVFANGPLNLSYRGGEAAVNVTDGGILTINKFQHGAGGTGGTTTITLNDGTIRANDNSTTFIPNKENITVKVGAGGGTLDVNSKTIKILRPILEDTESIGGGMTFKGGGVVTLAEGNTYTGKTTVEVGTTVYVAAPSDIGGGLVVTLPEATLADNVVYTLVAIEGEGAFAADMLSNVDAPQNATLRLSSDKKSVLCIYGNPTNTWIGGASGSLSEATNWSLGYVPSKDMSCIIGNATAANLVNPSGSAFAPSTIVFPADTALITISGEGMLSDLETIVNNSLLHHEIACSVDASEATPTLPLAEGNYLVFSGGIALKTMPSVQNMWLAGVWNLTGDWNEPPSGTHIVSGSLITVSGMLKSGYNIYLSVNATLQVATARANFGADGKNRFLHKNYGTFIVTGEMEDTIGDSGSTSYNIVGLSAYGNNSTVVRANGLVHAGSTQSNHRFHLNNGSDVATNTVVLGTGGLSFRNNRDSNSSCYPYFQIDAGKAVTLASSADWSFGKNSVSGKDLCLELESGSSAILDTSDYDNRDIPHTIRALGRIGSGGSVIVKGCGKLSFEYASDFLGGLYVTDTATVACNVGCAPTRSTVHVGSSASFEIAQSGVLEFHTGMVLEDGATLKFNFTNRNKAPILKLKDRMVEFGDNKTIKVSLSGVRPSAISGNRWVLTEGGRFAWEGEDGSLLKAEIGEVANAPKWLKRVVVNDEGDLCAEINPLGTSIVVR